MDLWSHNICSVIVEHIFPLKERIERTDINQIMRFSCLHSNVHIYLRSPKRIPFRCVLPNGKPNSITNPCEKRCFEQSVYRWRLEIFGVESCFVICRFYDPFIELLYWKYVLCGHCCWNSVSEDHNGSHMKVFQNIYKCTVRNISISIGCKWQKNVLYSKIASDLYHYLLLSFLMSDF